MSFLRKFLKTDPIVTELLKAGFGTYKKHVKAYILLNIFFIMLFLILSSPRTLTTNMKLIDSVFAIMNSFQSIFLYGLIGLIITIVTYYITFKQTLSSGELGLEIKSHWTKINHFLVILVYNMFVLAYLLVWAFFFKILFIILTANSVNSSFGPDTSYAVLFLAFFFIIFLLIAFFLFVVKFTYYIYMLDELKVPTQALDPIIFVFGLLYGLLILVLDLLLFLNPQLLLLSVILTYLTPGTIIMPILGYSMAHLKVASTVLGFEPLMVYDDEPTLS